MKVIGRGFTPEVGAGGGGGGGVGAGEIVRISSFTAFFAAGVRRSDSTRTHSAASLKG